MSVFVSEEVWHVSSWRLRSGSGAFPHLAAEQTSHQRRLSVPTIHPALPTLNKHALFAMWQRSVSHKMCCATILKSNNKEFWRVQLFTVSPQTIRNPLNFTASSLFVPTWNLNLIISASAHATDYLAHNNKHCSFLWLYRVSASPEKILLEYCKIIAYSILKSFFPTYCLLYKTRP